MITDINITIKNEKDRELYVQLRNVLDNYFSNQIELHKNKDHNFNECEVFDFSDILRREFSKQLKDECKSSQMSEIEIIEWWINHNESELLKYMSSLVVLHEEYNRRKQ